jgi:DNA-binding transcriptional LysR family regulator
MTICVPHQTLEVWMELRHLRYFHAVATERSFTRAAQRLHMAQPPLSRQIRKLEEELGAALIERDTRPLRLTEAGRLLFAQAEQILARAEQARASIRALAAGGRRRFTIGFVGSILYGPLPAMIRGLRAGAPHVEVTLAELTTLEQIAALKDGRIDVGFGRLRIEDPAIRRSVLYEEPLITALAADDPLAAQDGPIGLHVLAGAGLILYPSLPRPSYADQVLAVFHDHALQPTIVHEARELQAALGLVASAAGACVVPASVSRLRRDDIIYRSIFEAGATTPVVMSSRLDDLSPELALLQAISHRTTLEWVARETGP